jgi:hypothetical protein
MQPAVFSISGVLLLGTLILILFGSAIGGFVAIFSKSIHVPARFAAPLLSWGCISLFIAGVLVSGAILNLFSFPLAAVSFGLFALFYRAFGPWRAFATVTYRAGMPFLFWGAFHFGGIAAALNALATHYAGPMNLPPRPNVAQELILWAIPALIVSTGLKLADKLSPGKFVLACTLLLLLNPPIVAVGAWLRLPLSLCRKVSESEEVGDCLGGAGFSLSPHAAPAAPLLSFPGCAV